MTILDTLLMPIITTWLLIITVSLLWLAGPGFRIKWSELRNRMIKLEIEREELKRQLMWEQDKTNESIIGKVQALVDGRK